MRKIFLVLSFVVIVSILSGCSAINEYAGKNDLVGKPIPKEEAVITPYYRKAGIRNDSRYWLKIQGIKRGDCLIRPYNSQVYGFNRQGAGIYVVHAYHQGYIDKEGNWQLKDFAGENTFPIHLGNSERTFYGEKVADVITFTNNSFIWRKYPTLRQHGPHWWDNFTFQEMFEK